MCANKENMITLLLVFVCIAGALLCRSLNSLLHHIPDRNEDFGMLFPDEASGAATATGLARNLGQAKQKKAVYHGLAAIDRNKQFASQP